MTITTSTFIVIALAIILAILTMLAIVTTAETSPQPTPRSPERPGCVMFCT